MRVAVVFAGLMVFVVGTSRSQFLQPLANIFDQAAFVIIHVDGCGDVHGRHEAEAVLYSAATHDLLDLIGDVHHFAALLRLEHKILRVALHTQFSSRLQQSLALETGAPFILITIVTSNYPQSGDELSHRGIDLLAAGDPSGAANAFREAIATDPANYEAHHGLVRALRDAGKLEQSIAAALALTALTPHDPLAHAALSISLQTAGHIPEAEAAAARARVLEWKVQLQEPPDDDTQSLS